ncbi:MAG: HlyD family efflux transporter periplasmic adaptor subunit [Rhodanobacter sp.]|nr:MAG: HlyD family efflux transporter periplasmic adaptor subunit [Rhodanobacter sp.]
MSSETVKIQEQAGRPATLFRQRAQRRTAHLEGMVVLRQPVTLRVLVVTIAAILGALCIFLCTATYAKRQPAVGYVAPASGLIQILSPVGGQVQTLEVKEGQRVKQGTPLFSVVKEQRLANGADAGAQIDDALVTAAHDVAVHLQAQRNAGVLSVERLRSQEEATKEQAESLKTRLGYANERVHIMESQVTRYQSIVQQGYVSQSALDQRRTDLLAARSDRDALALDLNKAAKDIQDLGIQIAQKKEEQQAELSDLSKQQMDARQQLLQSKMARSSQAVAPVAGQVSALRIHTGETVGAQAPVMMIVPDDSENIVELYVPGSAIASVHAGQSVYLKYRAYPYQRYGLHAGQIVDVSGAAFAKGDLPIALPVEDEPLYRVRVKIEKPSQSSRGDKDTSLVLRPGMLVDADIVLQRMPLWAWLFKPLSNKERVISW